MKLIKIIFLKEWLEAIRDRRTLLIMFVVPLLFYPLAFGLMGYLSTKHEVEMQERTLRLGVTDASLLELGLGGEGVVVMNLGGDDFVGMLNRAEADVIIERVDPARRNERDSTPTVVDGDYELRLHYLGTVEGESGIVRVEELLERSAERLVEKKMVELGGTEAMTQPIRFERENHAQLREVVGSYAGGLLGYMLVFLGFTGCMATAVDTGAGEKERGTLEAMLVTPMHRGALLVGKLFYVLSSGLFSVISSVLGLVLLAAVGVAGSNIALGIGLPEVVILVSILTLLALIFAASILLGISLISSSPKQAQAVISPLFLLVSLALIFSILPGTEFSGTIRWVPLLSVALAIREAILGSLTLVEILGIAVLHLSIVTVWLVWIQSQLRKEGNLLG